MNDIQIKALHSHHKATTVCVVCALNVFAKLYYLVLDSQVKIDGENEPKHPDMSDKNLSLLVLDSSARSSMNYLISRLQDTEIIEFEAWIAVARNLIEKMSRLADILDDDSLKIQASKDFSDTVYDLKNLFEVESAKKSASEMKKSKWLGRGTQRSNIKDEKYELIYAYLSRMLHVSNMDTLLNPKEDRFLVKAYILVSVGYLYHYYSSQLPYISKERLKMHTKCCKKLKSLWLVKGLSPEILIYCTTYYKNERTKLENSTLEQYTESLQYAFDAYDKKEAYLVPRFKIS